MAGREDYVEVQDRIAEFYAKYPDGSLQVVNRELVEFPGSMGWWWVVEAHAYRTPDDPRPGVGLAQEAVPGRTQFTRGSELMNAETSAWGRAMAALGIATHKGIASGHEVRQAKARQSDDQYGQTKPVQRARKTPDDPADAPYQTSATQPPARPAAMSSEPIPTSAYPEAGAPSRTAAASDKSVKMFWALIRKTGMSDDDARQWVAAVLRIEPDWSTANLTQAQVSLVIDRLKAEQ